MRRLGYFSAVRILVPLGVFALILALLLLIAWIFDLWLVMLFVGIPVAAVLAELVWRNWWGDRFANRNAKPS